MNTERVYVRQGERYPITHRVKGKEVFLDALSLGKDKNGNEIFLDWDSKINLDPRGKNYTEIQFFKCYPYFEESKFPQEAIRGCPVIVRDDKPYIEVEKFQRSLPPEEAIYLSNFLKKHKENDNKRP